MPGARGACPPRPQVFLRSCSVFPHRPTHAFLPHPPPFPHRACSKDRAPPPPGPGQPRMQQMIHKSQRNGQVKQRTHALDCLGQTTPCTTGAGSGDQHASPPADHAPRTPSTQSVCRQTPNSGLRFKGDPPGRVRACKRQRVPVSVGAAALVWAGLRGLGTQHEPGTVSLSPVCGP